MSDGKSSPVLAPLAGETGIPPVGNTRKSNISAKAIFALVLIAASLIVGATVLVKRMTAPDPAKVEAKEIAAAPKPVAAIGGKRPRIEAPAEPVLAAASAPAVAAAHVVPAIDSRDDAVKPIPVRGTEGAAPGARKLDPIDAPLMVVSDARAPKAPASKPSNSSASSIAPPNEPSEPGEPTVDSLEATRASMRQYRQQLEGMVAQLQGLSGQAQGAGGATPAANLPALPQVPAAAETATTLMGGGSSKGTARVQASTLGNRSLTLPRGTTFTCALKVQVITSASGDVSCQVLRNVYSDDGRVLLVERGSHLDGKYRMQNVRPGVIAIPATWERLRMPNGVTIEMLDSNATGPLGAAGIDAIVDNRWMERLGAALLVSLVDGAVKIAIANAQDGGGSSAVVVSQAGTSSSQLAEEILKSTINLPPILFKNQGGVVGVYVQKDLDFSSVYELRAAAR